MFDDKLVPIPEDTSEDSALKMFETVSFMRKEKKN